MAILLEESSHLNVCLIGTVSSFSAVPLLETEF